VSIAPRREAVVRHVGAGAAVCRLFATHAREAEALSVSDAAVGATPPSHPVVPPLAL